MSPAQLKTKYPGARKRLGVSTVRPLVAEGTVAFALAALNVKNRLLDRIGRQNRAVEPRAIALQCVDEISCDWIIGHPARMAQQIDRATHRGKWRAKGMNKACLLVVRVVNHNAQIGRQLVIALVYTRILDLSLTLNWLASAAAELAAGSLRKSAKC
jgi:hypothetical protein